MVVANFVLLGLLEPAYHSSCLTLAHGDNQLWAQRARQWLPTAEKSQWKDSLEFFLGTAAWDLCLTGNSNASAVFWLGAGEDRRSDSSQLCPGSKTIAHLALAPHVLQAPSKPSALGLFAWEHWCVFWSSVLMLWTDFIVSDSPLKDTCYFAFMKLFSV